MKIIYIILFAAISASCSKAPVQPNGDVAKIIEQVNADATTKLGIGLHAIGELTDISDISLTSESAMHPDALAKLRVLESAGYVTITLGDGPEGMNGSNIKFYKVQKTAKGLALTTAVSRL